MYLIVLLYMLCASTFTISKWGLAYTEPIFFVAIRMLLAGSLLCGYLVARGGFSTRFWSSLKKDWFLFAQLIIFHIYLTYICDLCALKNISSIESAFIYNLSPFIAAFLSYLWFGENMTRKKWFGLLLGFVAFLPQLLYAGFGSFWGHAWPRLMTLLAVASSAYGWIVLRALVKKGYSPLVANGVAMLGGGLWALGTSCALEPWQRVVSDWVPFMQAVVLLVAIANIAFYNLYGYLLERYTATFLSFAGFMCPLFTAVLGYLFFGETFPSSFMVSFVLVCIGLLMFYHEELRQGYVK
jgi:drug/metabolite transporter (DMT)-like permease